MDTSGVIALTAGANTQDLFYIFITTAGVLLCEWWDGGTSQARLQTPAGSISVGDSFKIAVAYQDNDFVAYWNGTQIGTDSSGIAPTPTLSTNRKIQCGQLYRRCLHQCYGVSYTTNQTKN